MSESDDIEGTRGASFHLYIGAWGLPLVLTRLKNARIFSCALLCLGAAVWKNKIPLNFASGLLIPLSLVRDPKIAPLVGGWPVFKTWLKYDFRGHHCFRPYPESVDDSTLDPWPLAALFFKPFNSIPALFLRENFLWIEGQAVTGRLFWWLGCRHLC